MPVQVGAAPTKVLDAWTAAGLAWTLVSCTGPWHCRQLVFFSLWREQQLCGSQQVTSINIFQIFQSAMSAMASGVLTSSVVLKDENGLILRRKITNPCMEAPSVREVHREIRWNSDK